MRTFQSGLITSKPLFITNISYIIIIILIAGIVGCRHTPEPLPPTYTIAAPRGFPPVVSPPDNPPTPAKIALGKALFYDPLLSRDNSISCSSCHLPDKAFTDGKVTSIGIQGRLVTRNSMPLFNLAYAPELFWEGRAGSLEQLALIPIQAHNEMDLTLPEMTERLKATPRYVQQFQEVFGRTPNPEDVAKAIAAFLRTMLSGNSPYDQYLAGNSNALSDAAFRGMELFFSEKTECFHCHSGILFTDFTYQNNGLYENYPDSGRINVTRQPFDRDLFRVPSLRNVTKTAPYMHDGYIPTLDSVIGHYMTGGKIHPNKSNFLRPFSLTAQERSDLLAFLAALTDETFIQNPAFRP